MNNDNLIRLLREFGDDLPVYLVDKNAKTSEVGAVFRVVDINFKPALVIEHGEPYSMVEAYEAVEFGEDVRFVFDRHTGERHAVEFEKITTNGTVLYNVTSVRTREVRHGVTADILAAQYREEL